MEPAKRWPVAEAKAKLSQVIDQALAGAPQTITRHGREAVVVVSAAEWRRWTERRGSLVDFLEASPLRNTSLESGRIAGNLRGADLG